MKTLKNILFSGFAIISLGSAVMRSSGSPEAKTGSPLDNGVTCALCHVGNPVISSELLISTDVPESGYIPGDTYNITILVPDTKSVKRGFEVTAETETAKVGTWSVVETNVKVISDGTAVTHNSAGNYSSWVSQWTAPIANTGNVSFFAAVNSSNSSSNTLGDQVFIDSLDVFESSAVGLGDQLAEALIVFPNPTSGQLNVQGVNALEIMVYSIEGDLLLSSPGDVIDVTALASGNYIAKIKTESNVVTSKFVKQ